MDGQAPGIQLEILLRQIGSQTMPTHNAAALCRTSSANRSSTECRVPCDLDLVSLLRSDAVWLAHLSRSSHLCASIALGAYKFTRLDGSWILMPQPAVTPSGAGKARPHSTLTADAMSTSSSADDVLRPPDGTLRKQARLPFDARRQNLCRKDQDGERRRK